MNSFLVAIHSGSRISRDVYVLDITVNFMLNKCKSKKAAGASPQTPLKEQSALTQTPLLSREGHAPSRTLLLVVNIFIRPFPKILDPPLPIICINNTLQYHRVPSCTITIICMVINRGRYRYMVAPIH